MRSSLVDQILNEIKRPKILVVGDIILDRYITGQVDRISPEAPIQVLRVLDETTKLGGAGNVADNLAKLDADTTLVGVIGDDEAGRQLRQKLKDEGICDKGLYVDKTRRTTLKSRMMAQRQQILRVDYEDSSDVLNTEPLKDKIREILPEQDLVIISDYAKGVLTLDVLEFLIKESRARKIPVIVDPKGRDYSKYRGATMITPNLKEAQLATGKTLLSDAQRYKHGLAFAKELELEALCITLGEDGICLIENNAPGPFRIRAKKRGVFDVTGAGDSAIATMGLVIASGKSKRYAIELANFAGGIVVAKVGTAAVTRDELREAARIHESSSSSGRFSSMKQLTDALSLELDENDSCCFVIGSFLEASAQTLSLFRRCDRKADQVVAVVIGTDQTPPFLLDLRTVDKVVSSRDARVALESQNPEYVAFESDMPELREYVSGLRAEIID